MKLYLNALQRDALLFRCHTTVICAGRGTGKGVLHAAMNLQNFQQMPRSTTAFVVPNARRGLTNTLPSMFCHWEAWGYKRGYHWVVGQRPPRSLGWPDPLYKPESYENIISFYTGAIGQIVSQDRKGTSNSKSFDFVDVDEAKYINFEQLKSETFPANRGQVREFGHLPYHHGLLITSDMPVSKKGSWFLNYEKESDPELLDAIRALVAERWWSLDTAGEVKRRQQFYRQDHRDAYDRALNALRREAVFYGVYPSLVNLEVLGEAWFRQMKRDLPPAEFNTSILCRRVEYLTDGFYSSLGDQHLYNATDYHRLDAMGYDTSKLEHANDTCILDADLKPDLPLLLGFDYNSNINCLVVAQADESARRLNVVKSFFTKYDQKLPQLVDNFCLYYEPHPNHDAVFYFDSTALGSSYAVNDQDFRWVIVHQLELHGWRVRPVFIGRPLGHLEKQMLINRALEGRARLQPFFNEQNNESLLISMRSAGVYNGHKDKRLEKVPETLESPLEERTDFSDAYDTVFIGAERFPQSGPSFAYTSDF